MSSIVMVLTAARHWTLKDGTEQPTGFWAEEFTSAHQLFTAAGVEVTLATPGGVRPVVDERSLAPGPRTGDVAEVAALRAYLDQTEALLAAPRRLEDLNPADYDALFIPGGHGPMQDLSESDALGRLLVALVDTPGKVIGSVCHGAAGLLPARHPDGRWAFEGRRLTGFTNDEETRTGYAPRALWLLEDRLRASGGKFDAGTPFDSHVIVDGDLVTGQNPASTAGTAQRLLDLLTS